MTGPHHVETAINASKLLMALDHLKNNRIEYLLLLAIGHLVGATTFVAEKAAGVCA
jgi:hypothetical protein